MLLNTDDYGYYVICTTCQNLHYAEVLMAQ